MQRTAVVILCLTPMLSYAEGWDYSVAPYLWLPTIEVDSSDTNGGSDRPEDSPIAIGPTDYLSSLNFGIMLAGDMRNNEWVIMGDLIYLDFGIDDKDIDFARPGSGPVAGSYRLDLTANIYTLLS